MKSEFASDVFANPKDKSFESSINQIYQTFDGQDCYPTLEEKASMLLYLITKNHSFSDGNTLIARKIANSIAKNILKKSKCNFSTGILFRKE